MELPEEVLIAKTAYLSAYDKIRPAVKENRKKYIGTDFEDCPPLIKEQGQFFVKRERLLEVRERLNEKYGEHPPTWDFWIALYEKNSVQTKTL